ncbi:MAG: hypothetical protein A7316_10770 [Candidatus Altiarchaeales archaeon WOR_SM1_86-2]|nr:MAG: hypothetical protein A7316_10770 [Candidatus Altiarchaeales archaeon WOR_SM1_86-2]ODS35583.1 MAG: hypothetical protein A7315_14620 [Candidatus Altiarchaeales archaeon WOR_SM1_79]
MEIKLSNDEKFWIIFLISGILLVIITLYYLPPFITPLISNILLWLLVIPPVILSIIDILLSFSLQRPRLYEKYRVVMFFVLLVVIMSLYFPLSEWVSNLINSLFFIGIAFLIWPFIILIVEYFLERIILLFIGLRRTSDLLQNVLIYEKPPDLDDKIIYEIIVNTMRSVLGYYKGGTLDVESDELKEKWINSDRTSYVLRAGGIYRVLFVFYTGTLVTFIFKEYFRDLGIDEGCQKMSKTISYIFENILNFKKVEKGKTDEIIRYTDEVISEYSSRGKFIETIMNFVKDIRLHPKLIIFIILPILPMIIILMIWHLELWRYIPEIWNYIKNNPDTVMIIITLVLVIIAYATYRISRRMYEEIRKQIK